MLCKMEDMLYCPLTLKVRRSNHLKERDCCVWSGVSLTRSPYQNNMMAFIAELFWVFEKVKPTFVQPRDSQDMKDGTALLHNMMLYIYTQLHVH